MTTAQRAGIAINEQSILTRMGFYWTELPYVSMNLNFFRQWTCPVKWIDRLNFTGNTTEPGYIPVVWHFIIILALIAWIY